MCRPVDTELSTMTKDRYYTTTDPDEADWLCDMWEQPLTGRLVAAIQAEDTPDAARTFCDKLGRWTFGWSTELQVGVAAYQRGKEARRRALQRRQAIEDRAAEQAYRDRQPQSEQRAMWVNAEAGILSLDYVYDEHDGQPMTLLDCVFRSSDGTAPYDGDPATPRTIRRQQTIVLLPVANDEERHLGTPISRHPRYCRELDKPEVARRAVLWLYRHEYFGLLEQIGIHEDDLYTLDAVFGDGVAAETMRRKSERLLDRGSRTLLRLYRERTGHIACKHVSRGARREIIGHDARRGATGCPSSRRTV